jgi:hypothetical protein
MSDQLAVSVAAARTSTVDMSIVTCSISSPQTAFPPAKVSLRGKKPIKISKNLTWKGVAEFDACNVHDGGGDGPENQSQQALQKHHDKGKR